MPKFAANLSTQFGELPFIERFAAAANAGFRAVEFLFPYDFPAEVIKAELDKHQLELVLFNTAAGNVPAGEWGVSAIPGREADARADIDRALEYALALNVKQVHVMAATVPNGADRAEYEATFVRNMHYASEQFAPHSIRLLLEALNPVTKPNYLYSSQYQTLAMMERIDRPNVFTQLDLFHAQLVDGNLTHLIREYAGRYRHIQIASAPHRLVHDDAAQRRFGCDDNVQIASAPHRHEPDEGEVNYAYIFNLLDEVGYDGWVGCEYIPRDRTEAGLGWFAPYAK